MLVVWDTPTPTHSHDYYDTDRIKDVGGATDIVLPSLSKTSLNTPE